jgi:hypothetical protein
MKINISKQLWEKMGKQAGWFGKPEIQQVNEPDRFENRNFDVVGIPLKDNLELLIGFSYDEGGTFEIHDVEFNGKAMQLDDKNMEQVEAFVREKVDSLTQGNA